MNKEAFELTEDQLKMIDKWIKSNPAPLTGAIGGRYTYSFTPTTLGVVTTVRNNSTGKELDVTNYLDW